MRLKHNEMIVAIRSKTAEYITKRQRGEDPRNLRQFIAWVLDVYGTGEKAVLRKLDDLDVLPGELENESS